jgi:hypothetical protein
MVSGICPGWYAVISLLRKSKRMDPTEFIEFITAFRQCFGIGIRSTLLYIMAKIGMYSTSAPSPPNAIGKIS